MVGKGWNVGDRFIMVGIECCLNVAGYKSRMRGKFEIFLFCAGIAWIKSHKGDGKVKLEQGDIFILCFSIIC